MIFTRVFGALLTVAIVARGVGVDAACGWYLLQPPLLDKSPTEEEILRRSPQWRGMSKAELRDIIAMASLDRDAPLSRWSHDSSFDSADACEQARRRLIQNAASREPELRRTFLEGLPKLGTELATAARCIASDDLRLSAR
jgi:hypothetical protein